MSHHSIALTRIHTPEDYWERMACAETKLVHRASQLTWFQPNRKQALLCLKKARELSDRYHERWTINRKEYFG